MSSVHLMPAKTALSCGQASCTTHSASCSCYMAAGGPLRCIKHAGSDDRPLWRIFVS
jgi:hypothetical protein